MPELPARPSREYLRKAAKRLAREQPLQLAAAQRLIAGSYGEPSWAALMQRVDRERGETPSLPYAGWDGGGGVALWDACASDAPDDERLAAVRELLALGANPRHNGTGETPLHAAARRGPLAIVETLIAAGALEWQPDADGRTALDAARDGSAQDRAAIVTLLERPVITDPDFRAAVTAIHAGDVAVLTRLLDERPQLLHDRAIEPPCYHERQRHDYFLDPKLFWFVAYNPALTARMPDNIIDIARLMIARGVEPADLDYTLELVMSGRVAREQGFQGAIIGLLLGAGARLNDRAIVMAAAHRELAAIRDLLAQGYPMTVPIAAALGDRAFLAAHTGDADASARQVAFGLAVINGEREAAEDLLGGGVDIDAYLPVHAHSTALHQAVANGDLPMIGMLLAHGAVSVVPQLEVRGTSWSAWTSARRRSRTARASGRAAAA